MVDLTINGQSLHADEGTTILQAARQAGITIPTLCDHPDLKPYGGCRLCLVEVKGSRGPVTACTFPVGQDMQVETETEELAGMRRFMLELLLSKYYAQSAEDAPPQPETEFMHWLQTYQVNVTAASAKAPRFPINADPNPFVYVDMNKCILCMRCVRACAEIQGRFVWKQAYRGSDTQIVAGAHTDMLSARCESCGACVAYCPTGALDNKMSFGAGLPDRVVTTTCTYCGVGCQLDLNIKDDRIMRVTSNPDSPVNGMHLCVKGRYGYDFVHHHERLEKPQVRRYLLEGTPRPAGRGEWVEVDWDTALDITARKLAHTRDSRGPDSVGVLCSAKCTNEENYLMNKFARQVVGTNNIDHCARL
jgi:predicted molibdopterin-dependent oxidoreductase YjgC